MALADVVNENQVPESKVWSDEGTTKQELKETMEELKKCTWPTWEELQGSTVVVIVSVGLLGIFTVGVDLLVASIIRIIV